MATMFPTSNPKKSYQLIAFFYAPFRIYYFTAPLLDDRMK
ncbi:hypothetical protein HMPREF9176_0407 [Streptococcus downei F0415]|nr:hypothetical protein HMPREF9176_0407 [Streptococcus downei F0415]